MKLCFHYTYPNRFPAILESGFLLPPCLTKVAHELQNTRKAFGENVDKNEGMQADAKLLMFSSREDWEPASFRGFLVNGKPLYLEHLEDYAKYGISVYRFAVNRKLLLPWMSLKTLCGMRDTFAQALEMTGRSVGSNPHDWWGTMRPIPREKWLSVEVYKPHTETWEPYAGN